MNNDTARGRVAEALQEFNHCADDFYCEPPDIDSDEGIAVTSIAAHSAWLWERSDDPAVVEDFRRLTYDNAFLITADGDRIRRQTEYADKTLKLALTALLGPRKETTNDN